MSAIAADDGALRRFGIRLAAIGLPLGLAAWGSSLLLAGPFGGLVALRDATGLESIRRAGAASLTVYTVHVLAASAVYFAVIVGATADMTDIPWYFSSGVLWAIHITGVLLIGPVLAVLDRRGPLETFVSWSGRLLAGSKRTRAQVPAGSA